MPVVENGHFCTADALASSHEHTAYARPLYGDYFILCALAEIYGVTLVVITDKEQDPSRDTEFVFVLEPQQANNKVAVLALAKGWWYAVKPK